jgi:hypothetical protein
MLFRYDPCAGFPYLMPSLEVVNPWEQQTIKDDTNKNIPSLIDIAASSEGNLFAIRGDDNTAIKYDWTKKVWSKLPASNAATVKLTQIAVANANNIYACDGSSTYHYVTATSKTQAIWKKISDGAYIEAGMSSDKKDIIVIGINKNGNAYQLIANRWTELRGNASLDCITIGDENKIFAISKDGFLMKLKDYKSKKKLDNKSKTWTHVLTKDKKKVSGLTSISVNAKGTRCALDGDDNVYIAEETPAATTAATATAGKAKQTRHQAVKAGKIKPAKTIQKGMKVKRKAAKGHKAPASTQAKTAAAPAKLPVTTTPPATAKPVTTKA